MGTGVSKLLLCSGDEGFRQLSAVDPEGDSLLQQAMEQVTQKNYSKGKGKGWIRIRIHKKILG